MAINRAFVSLQDVVPGTGPALKLDPRLQRCHILVTEQWLAVHPVPPTQF
jgi:hypothetical protein